MESRVHRVRLLALPRDRGRRESAKLLLGRLVGLSKKETDCLSGTLPCFFPVEYDQAGATEALAALHDAHVSAEVVFGVKSSTRCTTHPRLLDENRCTSCGARVCRVCIGSSKVPQCAVCAARKQSARRWQRVRVLVLLAIALVISTWGLSVAQRRSAREQWQRTLEIAVIFLVPVGLPPPPMEAYRTGLAELERRLNSEFVRYRDGPMPFTLHAFGPVEETGPLDLPPADGSWWQRLRYSRAMTKELERIRRSSRASQPVDATLLVQLRAEHRQTVEGSGEARGDFGIIVAPREEQLSALTLTAIAHELLHCVGATDKYTEAGHARVPEGLAEPELVPRFPQQYAEVMVGEVALSPNEGKVPETLSQLRIGPRTAAEIRWTR